MSINHSFVGRTKIIEVLNRTGCEVFFLGIGGVGQSTLARLLHARGYAVSGSDRERSDLTDALISEGIPVYIGHRKENFHTQDILVYTLAVDSDTPELISARERGALAVSRAELLGAVMSLYTEPIGISGTHGKSTTTAILSHIFKNSGRGYTTVSGAPLLDSPPLYIGGEDYLIYEACEYRDSFLHFAPATQVITSLELDHTDYFKSIEELERSFRLSCRGARRIVVNTDSERLLGLCRELGGISYGQRPDADFRYIVNSQDAGGSDFTVLHKGERLGDFRISQIGAHNVSNATAAIAVSYIYNIKEEIVRKSLLEFTGISRRIERLGSFDGRTLIYDYAHHPSEILATLNTLREIHSEITVVFAPHTYSRTKALWCEFASALSLADFCILLPIYPAREEKIEGVSSERLAESIGTSARQMDSLSVMPYVRDNTRGAIVLMGAGDLNIVKNTFLQSKLYIKE